MERLTWSVCVDGYEWEQKGGVKFLKPKSSWRHREYALMDAKEHAGLFRRFAELIVDCESILAFANSYGLLKSVSLAESLGDWGSEILMVQQCVTVWDQAQNGSADQAAIQEMARLIANSLNDRTRVAFRQDTQVGGFSLQTVPTCLLGALRLQLAEAVSGNKQYQPCRVCGRWFEAARGVNRRFYCRDACRSMAYRARQAAAGVQ